MIPHAVTINRKTATIDITCRKCNKQHTFVFALQNYIDWMVGKPYPDMDSDARELLSSGQCNQCLDDMLDQFTTNSHNDYFMET